MGTSAPSFTKGSTHLGKLLWEESVLPFPPANRLLSRKEKTQMSRCIVGLWSLLAALRSLFTRFLARGVARAHPLVQRDDKTCALGLLVCYVFVQLGFAFAAISIELKKGITFPSWVLIELTIMALPANCLVFFASHLTPRPSNPDNVTVSVSIYYQKIKIVEFACCHAASHTASIVSHTCYTFQARIS